MVGTTTDCFEPIFGFLRSFWFEKYRSASWSRIGMFSEPSGRSDFIPKLKKMRSIQSYVFLLFLISLYGGATVRKKNEDVLGL